MSPQPDWDAPEEFAVFTPGTYYAEVKGCEEKNAQKTGDPYFNVEWKCCETGDRICYDIIMLRGRGWPGIGRRKLKALGFTEGGLEAWDLIGKRAFIAVDWEDDLKGGKRLAVDIRANGSEAGYWPENAPPGEVTEPPSDDVDESAPEQAEGLSDCPF